MNHYYDLRYFTCNGQFIQSLNIFEELEYGRSKNNIGAANLILPLKYYNTDIFKANCFIEIWRYDIHTNTYKLVGNTCWLLQIIIFETRENGEETIELIFFDTISILKNRHNTYLAVDPTSFPGIQYPSYFDKPLDDIMKYIVLHNFGIWVPNPFLNTHAPIITGPSIPLSVNTTIRNTTLTIDSFQSAAPVGQIASAWKNCLDIINECANLSQTLNVPLWFDIEYISTQTDRIGNFVFKTWVNIRKNDLSNILELSIEGGTFSEAKLEIDFSNEKNVIYVLGVEEPEVSDGITDPLSISIRDNSQTCYFGWKEDVLDLSGDDVIGKNLDLMEVKGRQQLLESATKYKLTGKIIQQANLSFFNHYNYGDRIQIRYKKFVFIADVTKFDVTVDNQGIEEIQIPVESNVLKSVNIVREN